MNLVWHIVKKDLCSMRWLLMAFGVLQLVTFWMILDLSPRARQFHMVGIGVIAGVASSIMSACATAWLVHEDPLCSGRARWITMPIVPYRVRAAKVAAIAGIFWLVPSLVYATAWYWGGAASFWRMLLVSLVGVNLFVPVAAFLVAMLTENFFRFIIGFLALMVAMPLAGLEPPVLFRGPTFTQQQGAAVLQPVLFMAGFLGLVGLVAKHQYATRRTGHSIAWTVAGLSLIWLGLYSIESTWH